MARLQVQATALCLLALSLCAAASPLGYYYGGSGRRLSEAPGMARRELQSVGYYYGGSQRKLFAASYPYYGGRRLQESSTPFFVRPLFGNSFMPAAASSAAEVPVPHFFARQLQTSSRQLTYYYGSRRLQGEMAGLGHSGRMLSYYYGSH